MISSLTKNQAGKEEGVLEFDSKYVVRAVLTKKMFMEGLGVSQGAGHVDIWGKSIKSGGNSKFQGPGGLSGSPVWRE